MSKSIIAIAIVSVVSFNAAATIFQPSGPAVMTSSHEAADWCSVIVESAEAGFAFPATNGVADKYGSIILNSSFNADFVADVTENWTSMAPWGGEMPESWSQAMVHNNDGSEYVNISQNGTNTGELIKVKPNKDQTYNTFSFYTFAANTWTTGTAEVETTITFTCSPSSAE
ncbi:hypothetical protein [Vibrio sp. ER1A]|uniref:hypothetical protein n=1 Tax=Vibrio sp. ER1A TaxID=1517681 RepID=UPI0004DD18A4|nr:hypothetical protein [Vibrio sp. ER1A]KFA99274.1 hypothetical protein HW45_04845 [Vibrio sp. ER1A]